MKRLYLEFFLGVSALFFLCILTFTYVTQELTPDYDAEVEIGYVSGTVEILDDVAAQRGQEVANKLFSGFVRRNSLQFTRFPRNTPALSPLQETKLQRDGAVFAAENRYWVTFGDRKWVYYLEPDLTASVWQHLNVEMMLMWASFFATFALYSAIMIKLLARRFRMLEKATVAFSEGDFSVRASEKNCDQLGRLNIRFNQMADKISGLIQSHKQLSNAIAHELRTPIFRVQCQLEMLEDSPLNAEQQGHIAGIHDDMEELELLIEELLYFAKMERSGIKLAVSEQNIAEVLQRTVLHCQKDTTKQLRLDCPDNCYVMVDAHHIERAVSNIIRNAFRYAEEIINIRAYCLGHKLYIQIDDDGCGIPAEEREKVLQPFYRVGTARDRQSGGHGLGLAIVNQVVALHHGSIEISDSDSGGARFTISLPIKDIKD
ncbi:ATP-binding protein [Photobacterium nomapromontoriensis]|uniref:ATP-binding protein n=1 Tax=Photobacterium nomapromontoriensis TaxID=2910237 RepID=UPI003D09AFDE